MFKIWGEGLSILDTPPPPTPYPVIRPSFCDMSFIYEKSIHHFRICHSSVKNPSILRYVIHPWKIRPSFLGYVIHP